MQQPFDSEEPTDARLLAALPQQVWLLDAEALPLRVDRRLLDELGLDLPQLRQAGWRSRIHPEDLPAFEAAWLAGIHQGCFELDYRWRLADGSYRWTLARACRLDSATPRWLGTHTDIDARKAAEAHLRESDALWKLALESNGDGVWDWYVQAGIELYSARYLQMYGFDEAEIRPSPEEFDARTHPEDRAQMERDREAHFRGDTPIYSNEHRVQCKDGSWKWVLTRGMVISRDAQGRPLRMVGTHTDISRRKQQEALIWQQAHYDALTGLPNRSLLRQHLEQELARRHGHPRPLAVLFVDLDHFKEVNDTLGHDMGDALLQQAAARIQACLHREDRVARMGGDEFTVVLGALSDRAEAERVAVRLIDTLAEAFVLQQERVFVSASIGISLFPDDGQSIETLFKHADQALYVAKAAGRNRHSHFTPALQEAAQTRLRLANDLRLALGAGQLHLVYQPIVHLRDRRICKAEALLRWQHPRRGALPPGVFIPIAESTGLIIEIGSWVFRQAAEQARHWRNHLQADLQISVNKSPIQFRCDSSAARRAMGCDWEEQLQQLGLPGDALSIEITEGLLLQADAGVGERLQALRAAGMQIALDDFGTGYSSLSYLREYPIDLIKIDQSFVRDLQPGNKSLALCEAIIAMAHAMGMGVVAEGVETAAQCALLEAAGCDYGQGYLFARPMPAAELEAALLRQQQQQA